jgi:glycosyltransferase involved in cell wall biosynthesis
VYLEAQSCGVPVVAFKKAGVPEAVADENTGLLTPLYEFEPFIQAIERLLDEHELRRKMGRAARVYIRDCHDLNKNYQQMESMLQKIAHSDAQPQQV